MINTELSERCLARHAWILQTICCAALRITQQCCVLHMRTFPFPQEWRRWQSQSVRSTWVCTWRAHRLQHSVFAPHWWFFGLQRVLTGFSLANCTVPWPGFIRYCQMVVFHERYSGCLGNGNYHVLTQHHVADLGSVDQNSWSIISRAFKNAQQSWETLSERSLLLHVIQVSAKGERAVPDQTAEQ